MKRLSKKAQVMQNIGGIGISIATLVVLLAITFLVLSNVRTQAISVDPCADTVYYKNYNATANCCGNGVGGNCSTGGLGISITMNSTQELTDATATIPGWVPLIILVLIGGLILAMVKTFGDR